jgi:hypothetical protein
MEGGQKMTIGALLLLWLLAGVAVAQIFRINPRDNQP